MKVISSAFFFRKLRFLNLLCRMKLFMSVCLQHVPCSSEGVKSPPSRAEVSQLSDSGMSLLIVVGCYCC